MLDVLRVRATSKQDRQAGMPEIVPAYVGQSRALEQGLEVAVHDVLRIDRRADSGAENEPRVFLDACYALQPR
jgi:hypothetical protein